jgi:RsiW-degrading membrane proteinase PrsW (M82 family)
MKHLRTGSISRLIDSCEDLLSFISILALIFAGLCLYHNEARWPIQVTGLAFLFLLATFWSFYRHLRYEHQWLTRYDPPAKPPNQGL